MLLVMTEQQNRSKPVGNAIPYITKKTALVKKTAFPTTVQDILYLPSCRGFLPYFID